MLSVYLSRHLARLGRFKQAETRLGRHQVLWAGSSCWKLARPAADPLEPIPLVPCGCCYSPSGLASAHSVAVGSGAAPPCARAQTSSGSYLFSCYVSSGLAGCTLGGVFWHSARLERHPGVHRLTCCRGSLAAACGALPACYRAPNRYAPLGSMRQSSALSTRSPILGQVQHRWRLTAARIPAPGQHFRGIRAAANRGFPAQRSGPSHGRRHAGACSGR